MRQFELCADGGGADRINQFAVGMPEKHSPVLNAALSFVKYASLIEAPVFLPHIGRMLDTLADRIEQRMREIPLSQTDLANRLDWSVQRLNNYLGRRRTPDVPTLMRLANALNTSMDWLVGAEDARFGMYRAVIAEILEAADLPAARIDVVLYAAEQAMRLLSALPDEGDDRLRSRMAARAAWHQAQDLRPQ